MQSFVENFMKERKVGGREATTLLCCFMALHKPWLRLLHASKTSRHHGRKSSKQSVSRKGARCCKVGSISNGYKMPKSVRRQRQKVNGNDNEGKSGNKEAEDAVQGLEPLSKRIRTCLDMSKPFSPEQSTNLDVVRTLRASSVPLHRKIELSSKYVKLQRSQTKQNLLLENCIPMPQFVLYLSEWVQTTLIVSSRQESVESMLVRCDDSVLESGEGCIDLPAYLDARCWDLLNWCLLSGHIHNSITISSRLLHPITSLLTLAAFFYNEEKTKQLVPTTNFSIFGMSRDVKNDSIPSKNCIAGRNSKITFTITLLHLLSKIFGLILSSDRKMFRPSLEEWLSLFLEVLKIATLISQKVVLPLQDLKDALHTNITFVLQGFLSFITSYPNQKLIFQTIVERSLESLLNVFSQLSLRFDKMISAVDQQKLDPEKQKLVIILEEILENSLFHAAHVEGFSEVCSLVFSEVASQESDDTTDMDHVEKKSHVLDIPLSYHRLFFDKIEQLRNQSNYSVLQSVGWLFRTYARKLKIIQHIVDGGQVSQSSLTKEEITGQHIQDLGRSETNIVQRQSEKCAYPAEKLFIVFAKLLILLKDEIEKLIVFEKDLDVATKLSKIQALMAAVNGLLAAAQTQHIYVPVDDASTKLHMTFLKEFHLTLMLIGGFVINLHFESLVPANDDCSMNGNASHLHSHNSTMTSVLLAEALKEVIYALGYMLELECRVFEDHLAGTWLLILSSASLWYALEDEGSHSISIEESEKKAIYFGSRILHIFSDLRKVHVPLHALCATLKSLLQPATLSAILFNFLCMEDASKKQQVTVNISHFGLFQKAVQRVFCAKSFLQRISASVSALPEGQAVEMMNMIALDMKEFLDALDKAGILFTRANSEFGLHFSDYITAVEVLGEIFSSSIEHINVTATNSFQVGISVRSLVDVTVVRVLSSFFAVANKKKEDGCTVSDNTKPFSSSNLQQNKECPEIGTCMNMEEFGKEIVSFNLFNVFLCLRIFFACRSLHRQCVILMPPKKAKRASALVHEPVLSGIDWSNIVTELSQEGFFSWIEGSLIGVSDVYVCFEDAFYRCIKKVPSINRITDQLRMLRLVDLNRYIQALECIKESVKAENAQLTTNDPLMGSALNEFLESSQGTSNDNGELSLMMVNSLLVAYEDEAVLLASSWMDDVLRGMKKLLDSNLEIGDNSCRNICSMEVLGSSKKKLLFAELIPDAVFLERTYNGIDSQNGCSCCQRVMCNLTENSILLSRWYLLSSNTDIWSKHANQECREKFVQFLFQFYKWARKGKVARFDGETHVSVIATCSTTCALQVLGSPVEVLQNLSFYEEESFRQLISTYFCKELKIVLDQCYEDSYCTVIAVEVTCHEQWADLVDRIGNFVVTNDADEEKLAGISKVVPTESVLKHFDGCSSLLHVLSLLPRGYLQNNDVSICLNVILSLERLLLESMLCNHLGPSTDKETNSPVHMWKLLILLGQCRRACKLLFLSAVDIHSTVNFLEDMNVPGCNVDVLRWFCISTRLAALCFDNLNHDTILSRGFSEESTNIKNHYKDALGFLNESTNQVIMNACEGIIVSKAKFILYQEVPDRTEDDVQKTEVFDTEKSEGTKTPQCKNVFEMDGSIASLAKVFLNEVLTLEKSLKEGCLDTCGQKGKSKTALEPVLGKLDKGDGLLAISSSPSILCWHEVVASAGFIHSFLWSVAIVFQDLDNYCHLHRTMNWRWVVQTTFFLQDLESVLLNILQDIILPNHLDCCVDASDVHTVLKNSTVNYDLLGGKKTMNKAEQQLSEEHPNNSDEKLSENGTNLLEINIALEIVVTKLSNEQLKFLGEFFMSLAALVKLRSLFCSSYAASLGAEKIKTEMSISLHVLLGVVYKVMSSGSFWVQNVNVQNMTWLFGSIKCMESFGSLLPSIKPLLSSLAFSKLLNVHIHLLATLLAASDVQDTETDNVSVHYFGQLINIVKSSFGALVRHAPRQHLILALQSIERAILNVWPSFEMVHGLGFSFGESGTVPRIVAAGIDCLGTTIDAVSGHRRLQLLVRHCPTFLGAILNLLAHLQGKALFNLQRENPSYTIPKESKFEACHVPQFDIVNSTSVVLKSLEIITRVSSRSAIFPMSSRHVALSLHCPTTLLKDFSQQKMLVPRRTQIFAAESPYLVQVFKACCKLLCALVRHRRREIGHCVALLEESINMLLYCLESGGDVPTTINMDTSVVECAQWLQRVYEEVGAHKDTLGRYCSQLVANYLSVLCANGPCAAGFHREVERALHPGVFALMDACSTLDLQQLHVTLGEGPERNALTTLRHDYEKHYKYRGKV